MGSLQQRVETRKERASQQGLHRENPGRGFRLRGLRGPRCVPTQTMGTLQRLHIKHSSSKFLEFNYQCHYVKEPLNAIANF
eukprot:666749-Amphidinium_carterae.1